MREKLNRHIMVNSMNVKTSCESLIDEINSLETTLELGDARAVDFGPAKLSLKKLCVLLDSVFKNEQRIVDRRSASVRYDETLDFEDDLTF